MGQSSRWRLEKTMRKTIKKCWKRWHPILFSKEKNSKTIAMLCGKIENVLSELVDLAKEISSRILEISVCFY